MERMFPNAFSRGREFVARTAEVRLTRTWSYPVWVTLRSEPSRRATRPSIPEATLMDPAPLPHTTLPTGFWPRVTEGLHDVGHGCFITTPLATAKPGSLLRGWGVMSPEGCQPAT